MMKPSRAFNWVAIALLMTGGAAMTACRRTPETEVTDAEDTSDPEQNLTFRNLTLEQADDAGNLQWRVLADEAVYSQDRQDAKITAPTGTFFSEGDPAYDVSAQAGDILDNGKQLRLRDQVEIKDLDSGAILKGEQLTWDPEQNVITLTGQVTGTHPDLTLSAGQAIAYIDEERILVERNVEIKNAANTIQMNGDRLTWQIAEEQLVADQPLQIQQRQGNQVTDSASANRASFDIGSEVATLQQNAAVALQDPPVRMTGDALRWDIANSSVTASQPFTLLHQGEQMVINAERGQGDLDTEVFRLQGNVSVLAQQTGGRLRADRLTWTVPTQNLVAEENVTYRQPDPPLDLTGDRAVGRLANQTIVITGDRVVTEIVPESIN